MTTKSWIERYRRKLRSSADAVAAIRGGQRVFVQGASATPTLLLTALAERAAELEGVRLVHLHTEGASPFLQPEYLPGFRHEALFVGANLRAAVNSGQADYIPIFLSEVPRLFASGLLPIDVALIHVSPPDAHGFCSLGVSVDVTMAAIRQARTVIALVNAGMPRTHGAGFVHVDQIDAIVEIDTPLPEIKMPVPDEAERRIGEHVAALIEDEATLQLGIGSIPNAVLAQLGSHRDLGLHTEMFSDGVIDLVEAGVITGARNPIHPGKLVTSFLMGTQRLYDFVHDNPQVEMRPADYTNDTSVIRRNHRMVAINSAIEIDLTGQVCAASIGDRVYSGFGGQTDFIRGAALADGGKAIMALPSMAAGGKVSRITGRLNEGAMVTLTQAHVHYVVTEYGVAHIYGKNLRERAEALIQIAHPSVRDDLRAFARERQRA